MSSGQTEDLELDDDLDVHHDESQSLLAHPQIAAIQPTTQENPSSPLPSHGRQSSFSKSVLNGGIRTPRTSNRVRFDVPSSTNNGSEGELQNDVSPRPSSDWLEEEDNFSAANDGARRASTGQRAPLLTGIEAPSVTVATENFDVSPTDALPLARPKSGPRGAFMNMANSIM